MKKPHSFETWQLLTQRYSVTSLHSEVLSYFLFNISHMQFVHIQNKSQNLLYIVESLLAYSLHGAESFLRS